MFEQCHYIVFSAIHRLTKAAAAATAAETRDGRVESHRRRPFDWNLLRVFRCFCHFAWRAVAAAAAAPHCTSRQLSMIDGERAIVSLFLVRF